MLWDYLGKVLSFALKRTTPTVDSLQILAASAVPAIAKLAGINVATSITNDVLAYIAAMAVAFVFLRLLSAPYFIWREQIGEIGDLKLELTKPERLQALRFAELRAKARFDLCAKITDLYWAELSGDRAKAAAQFQACATNLASAQTGTSFGDGLARLSEYAEASNSPETRRVATRLLNHMLDYLHGSVTDEFLGRQLPPKLEREKQL